MIKWRRRVYNFFVVSSRLKRVRDKALDRHMKDSDKLRKGLGGATGALLMFDCGKIDWSENDKSIENKVLVARRNSSCNRFYRLQKRVENGRW